MASKLAQFCGPLIYYNDLVGKIPEELSSLSTNKLKGFYVSANGLTGSIPRWLGNASSLLYLYMGKNYFQGSIPSELGKLLNLIVFAIGANNLSGKMSATTNFTGKSHKILASLFPIFSVSMLDETRSPVTCRFPYQMPLDYTNLILLVTILQLLDIGVSRFNGELPISIANFSTTLQQLWADFNQISWRCLYHISPLVDRPKGGDTWHAPIHLKVKKTLVIVLHTLSEIPEGIGKLERLQKLGLHDNRISGSVPEVIGNITKLQRLYLFTNYLSGNIAPSLGNCKQLENSLIGPLPMEVGNMSKPWSWMFRITDCPEKFQVLFPSVMLEFLSLGDNLFGRRIPLALSALKSLQFLDLSKNKLSGQISAYLKNFTHLEILNLSYNKLNSEVPHKGAFTNTSAFSFVGNRKLCGGIKSLGLPSCHLPGERMDMGDVVAGLCRIRTKTFPR
ncbi:receptor kinase-like protein Xa21 [Rhododendron vialii]|uniref:receptor kinase-like protein Xa21 n=1 Tax=Rhododendron vialii TaxID=182163 RepID=UPI00265DD442|nr:receptor kinase-like protein Xa21 [Rhododendron vialii]